MEMEKHLLITASSNISWKDAITAAISDASKTIDYLSSVKILSKYADIQGNKISTYHVDLDITFVIDDKNLIITCNLENIVNKINKTENQKIINEMVNKITKKNIINTYAILKSQKEKYILKIVGKNNNGRNN